MVCVTALLCENLVTDDLFWLSLDCYSLTVLISLLLLLLLLP